MLDNNLQDNKPHHQPTEFALEAKQLKKSYGPVPALQGVDLQLRPGEFVALLGPNGAGKSTLFQILTGLFLPDHGSLEIDGYDTRRNFTTSLGKIGTVFQQTTLDMDLSISANLHFHAALHGMPRQKAKQRIQEEAERMKIGDHMDKIVRHLSGGNRRKVELARSLIHDPLLLFMDEPTVGLDPGSRTQILNYTLELCRSRQMSVLWATHLVDEAEAADRVMVLDKGKVIASGTPSEIMEQQNSQSLSDAFFNLVQTDTSISPTSINTT